MALLFQNAPLAPTGIHQQTKRERQISIVRKVADRLRTPILFQQKIVFSQIVDDLSVLVAHRSRHIHYFYRDAKSGGLLRILRVGGWLLGRCLLAVQKSTYKKEGECDDENGFPRHWFPQAVPVSASERYQTWFGPVSMGTRLGTGRGKEAVKPM